MFSTRLHRNVTISSRISAGILSGVSITLFIRVMFRVYDKRFPSRQPGYSALAPAALAFAILWNIAALVTINKLGRIFRIIGDSTTAILMLVLGGVGFAHDDTAYLNNVDYWVFDNLAWPSEAIGGGVLMIIVVILELFLILLSIFKPKEKAQSELLQSLPPAYNETMERHAVEDTTMGDWESISTLDKSGSIAMRESVNEKKYLEV